MKVYLDSNSVQFLTEGMTSGQLQDVFGRSGYELSLGTHVIYELARAFVSNSTATQQVFRVLAHLDSNVHYVPPSQDLILSEVLQLRLGGKVLPVLSALNRTATRLELHRLACGRIAQARAFIAQRERDVELGHQRISATNRRLALQYLRSHPGSRSQIGTSFPKFRSVLRPTWEDLLPRLLGTLVPPALYQQIFRSPPDFPVLNTWLNCQLHLAFIAGVVTRRKERPSKGRLDDYRHVIECNAADMFVTNDLELKKIFPVLNPFRKVISWTEFQATLRQGERGRA